jgi:hypothetical protein
MAYYLDPKNDWVFYRIFGKHPPLLISFLNALMPLGPDQQIESVEYLPAEQVPDTPVLWLRFLQEIEGKTRHIDNELLANDIIRQAVDICEESGFTETELNAYDKYWDNVRVERALVRSSHAEGKAIGKAEGEAIGKEKGRQEAKLEMVENSFKAGYPVDDIAKITGLTPKEVATIIQQLTQ